MDILEKFGNTITDKGREAADKARKLTEIAGLKSQIGTCEEVIRKNYMEIGRLYYELYGNTPEEPFEKACRSVQNAKNGVEDLQDRIRKLKGL